jgi:peptidoglycan hydrolase CwlO-like protein
MIVDRAIIIGLAVALVATGIFAVTTRMQLGVTRADLAQTEAKLGQVRANLAIEQDNVKRLTQGIQDCNDATAKLKADSDKAEEEARRLMSIAKAENKKLQNNIADLKSKVRPPEVTACTWAEKLLTDELNTLQEVVQ